MDIEMDAYKSDKDVPKPENTDKKKTNWMTCDDCMNGSQSKIEEYYTRGRHSHVNENATYHNTTMSYRSIQ
jgi:hypothetical protein